MPSASPATWSSAAPATGCNSFAQIGTATGTTFNSTGLAATTSYSYRVRATDAAGNLGAFSNIASATTPVAPDTTPPGAPTGLGATAVAPTQISLALDGGHRQRRRHRLPVERCTGAGCTNFVQVATPTGTTFDDPGLSAGDHLPLPRARRRRRRQPGCFLEHRQRHHARGSGHHAAGGPVGPRRPRSSRAARSTSPGRPPPTTSASPATWSSAAAASAAPSSPRWRRRPAPPSTTPAWPRGPATATGARHRRRGQPRAVLEHRQRHHDRPRHHAAQRPVGPRGHGLLGQPDQPRLDGRHRQRRRDRLPDRALRGRRLRAPSPRSAPPPAPPSATPACRPPPPTATASAPPTRRAISARTRTWRPP